MVHPVVLWLFWSRRLSLPVKGGICPLPLVRRMIFIVYWYCCYSVVWSRIAGQQYTAHAVINATGTDTFPTSNINININFPFPFHIQTQSWPLFVLFYQTSTKEECIKLWSSSVHVCTVSCCLLWLAKRALVLPRPFQVFVGCGRALLNTSLVLLCTTRFFASLR